MGALRLILADQLSGAISSLEDADRSSDVILMAEVRDEATYVRHHKKKIAFLFAAMRHHAEALRADGYRVRYVKIEDEDAPHDLFSAVEAALKDEVDLEAVVVTKPGEWRLLSRMRRWSEALNRPVHLREDMRFIATTDEFADWADGRKQLRMEYFYRDMRRKTGLLMEGGEPAAGRWNFDQENRRSLPRNAQVPTRWFPEPDEVTREVIDLVSERFSDHFGDLEAFCWATTREGAQACRDHFFQDIFPGFGDYQDAIAKGEPWLWHSLLSMYLNCGLLDPLDLCQRAESEWKAGRVPINAAEGFIRQILGWREYVRGLYWLKMPDYAETNALGASRVMPEFYWSGETDMACMRDAIEQTKRHAYAHHIQRLMVTGNFALIAGISPVAVNEWYMCVYADAYEWVELPNTHGMALFADGGVVASKPYASSGAYINRMSDHCKGCEYDVKAKSGDRACPFNFLYWDFLARNADVLRGNPRMALVYKNLERKSRDELGDIRASAEKFLKQIGI